MISVAQAVEGIVKHKPYLSESLAAGIINISALARQIQEERFACYPGTYCNAQMTSKQLSAFAQPETKGLSLLKNAMERLNLSARAYDRILKVSRTIADLEGSEQIKPEHLAEAISYRNLDRENWAG